jgi:hypothetical protein
MHIVPEAGVAVSELRFRVAIATPLAPAGRASIGGWNPAIDDLCELQRPSRQ